MNKSKSIEKNHICGGFTLIELVLSMVIISICLTGTILTFITVAKANADPMIQQQAMNISKSYLEEILAKSFPTKVPCAGAPGLGRFAFANVCDYQGLKDIGVRDQNNQAIEGLAAYTVQVFVDASEAVLGGLKSGIDVVRVDVNVTHQNLPTAMVISGYKTQY